MQIRTTVEQTNRMVKGRLDAIPVESFGFPLPPLNPVQAAVPSMLSFSWNAEQRTGRSTKDDADDVNKQCQLMSDHLCHMVY